MVEQRDQWLRLRSKLRHPPDPQARNLLQVRFVFWGPEGSRELRGSRSIRHRHNLQLTLTVDNDRQGSNLENLVKKLRTITTVVQLLPFVYASLYVVAMLVYLFGSDASSVICDHLFYISPIVVVYNLVLSKSLRLCVWHKSACLLPVFPECVGVFDRLILNLSEFAVVINLISILVVTIVLLVSAYNVFFR